jgi:hypothetical protein
MRVKGLTILTDILNSDVDRLARPVHRDRVGSDAAIICPRHLL